MAGNVDYCHLCDNSLFDFQLLTISFVPMLTYKDELNSILVSGVNLKGSYFHFFVK